MSPVIADTDAPIDAVVTGASRGIGLAVVEALLGHPGIARVHALGRTATRCDALGALRGPRLQPVDIDLSDAAAIDAFGARLHAQKNRVQLVFNAAGLLHAPGLRPEKSLQSVDVSALQRVFALNTFAPILLARALQPVIPADAPAVFASVSARVGSIGDNALGGWYSYRASKAAQNQLVRTLSVEWKRTRPRAACVLLHPGTVDTDLSQPFQASVAADRLFTPARAARQLLDLVARITPGDTGRFIAWDGRDIPW